MTFQMMFFVPLIAVVLTRPIVAAEVPEAREAPGALSESVAKALITEWGQSVVSGNHTGNEIAQKFFFPDAILRGTVSAITRTQRGAQANSFTIATPSDDLKELTIGQYFDYFNGANLKGMSASWDNDNDYVVRVSSDALLCNVFKKFELPDYDATVIAVMSFIVKQKDGEAKILSLHSSPLHATPPKALHETILHGSESAMPSRQAPKLDVLINGTAESVDAELSDDEARGLIEQWGSSVINVESHTSGDQIARDFFFPDAVLRGTVSAMTRTQTGAIANTFTKPTPPATLDELTIGQYFDYFNGANLKDMNVKWNNANDFLLRISHDALLCNLFKKFTIGAGEVVAVMSFIVKKRSDGVKILSLHSSPIHCAPPSQLHETVLWAGCDATRRLAAILV